MLYEPPGDIEPNQLHDAQRARVDVQHTASTRGVGLCVQHDRACHRRLKDDASGDAELGDKVVRAGGKDDAADGGVGECTGQAGAGAHLGLQLTAVAGHRKLQTSMHRKLQTSMNVAGLGAMQHGAPCKESEGTVHALLLSRPTWPRARRLGDLGDLGDLWPRARRLGDSTVPCHERCHQQAPPAHKLPGIEYAIAIQTMSRLLRKAGRRHPLARG